MKNLTRYRSENVPHLDEMMDGRCSHCIEKRPEMLIKPSLGQSATSMPHQNPDDAGRDGISPCKHLTRMFGREDSIASSRRGKLQFIRSETIRISCRS